MSVHKGINHNPNRILSSSQVINPVSKPVLTVPKSGSIPNIPKVELTFDPAHKYSLYFFTFTKVPGDRDICDLLDEYGFFKRHTLIISVTDRYVGADLYRDAIVGAIINYKNDISYVNGKFILPIQKSLIRKVKNITYGRVVSGMNPGEAHHLGRKWVNESCEALMKGFTVDKIRSLTNEGTILF
jgi:hypothetical protein